MVRVDPRLYGENLGESNIDLARSIAEMTLIHVAMQRGMPILGICGGHQILNVYLGGTIGELNSQNLDKQRFMTYGDVELDQSSELAKMVDPKVPSDKTVVDRFFGAHNQVVKEIGGKGVIEGRKEFEANSLKSLSNQEDKKEDVVYKEEDKNYLKVVAKSKGDENIEAVEGQYGAPVIGLQFHPEVGFKGLPVSAYMYQASSEEEVLKNKRIFEAFKESAETFKNKKALGSQIEMLGEQGSGSVKERVEATNKRFKKDELPTEKKEVNNDSIGLEKKGYVGVKKVIGGFFRERAARILTKQRVNALREKENNIVKSEQVAIDEKQEKPKLREVFRDVSTSEQYENFLTNKKTDEKVVTISMPNQPIEVILKYVDDFINNSVLDSSKDEKSKMTLCVIGLEDNDQIKQSVEKRKEELKEKWNDNVNIMSYPKLNTKEKQYILGLSDIVISDSKGISKKESDYIDNAKLYIHNTEIVNSKDSFPTHSIDATYEKLANANKNTDMELLIKKAKVVSTDSNVIYSDEATNSLIKLSHEGKLNKDNAVIIKELIYEGSNPNLKFSDGSFLIDHCKDFDTMKLLIEHGAKLTKSASSKSFLTNNQKEKLQKDVGRFKEDFESRNDLLHEEFAKAIQSGDVKKVKGLMYHVDQIENHELNIKGAELISPIQLAVRSNKIDCLKLLLEEKASVNFMNNLGSALHYAVENNNVEAAKLLLQYGANPYAQHKGKTPCDLLEGKNAEYLEMLKMFVQQKIIDPVNDKLPKIAGAKIELMQELMFEKDNKYKNNDLHCAIYYLNKGESAFKDRFGDVTFEKILDQNFDKINDLNGNGKTPLSLCNDQAIRRQLVRCGADISDDVANKLDKTSQRELSDISDLHKKLVKDTKSYLQSVFEKNIGKPEKFKQDIRGKIEGLYNVENKKLTQEEKENIDKHSMEAYNKLVDAKTQEQKLGILDKLVDFFKRIIGTNIFNKLMKEASNELSNNLKYEIKGQHTKKYLESKNSNHTDIQL